MGPRFRQRLQSGTQSGLGWGGRGQNRHTDTLWWRQHRLRGRGTRGEPLNKASDMIQSRF